MCVCVAVVVVEEEELGGLGKKRADFDSPSNYRPMIWVLNSYIHT